MVQQYLLLDTKYTADVYMQPFVTSLVYYIIRARVHIITTQSPNIHYHAGLLLSSELSTSLIYFAES